MTGTLADGLKLMNATTITSNTTAPAAASARPSGTGVVDLAPTTQVPDLIQLFLNGTGADNSTWTARIHGQKYDGTQWIPFCLGEWVVTLSTFTNGGSIRYADTLVAAAWCTALEGIAFQTVSPIDNTPGHLLIDRKGSPILQLQVTLGTATGANASLSNL